MWPLSQVLHSMLDKELWKKLPMAAGALPDLARSLEGNSQNGLLAKAGSSSSLSAASTASQNGNAGPSSDGFDVYLAQGNPWRASQGRLLCSALPCPALLCSALLLTMQNLDIAVFRPSVSGNATLLCLKLCCKLVSAFDLLAQTFLSCTI